jgi:PAS domain-containing protein
LSRRELILSSFDRCPRVVRTRADTGEERWLSTLARIFRDASGAPCCSIGAHIAITRQSQIEEELRACREELATVSSQTIVGILRRDLSLPAVKVDKSAERAPISESARRKHLRQSG